MLTQYEQSGAHNAVMAAFEDAIRGHEKEFEDIDILDFMKKHDLVQPYKHHIMSHVVLGLTADMLHFLYEALRAFEKRKFSVGFSLLRKLLKEHLFFLSWVLSDDDDFIKRFEANNHETLNNVTKERRLDIFAHAIARLATSELFDSTLLWEMIYSKNHSNGFEPTCQRATHLITSKGDLLRTEDYSLNFVFEYPGNDHYYEFLYSKLPYILIFIVQVALELFNQIHVINRLTYSHLVFTTMGCYEALFLDGRSQAIAKMLNRQLRELLTCVHCEAAITITKRTAPALYLMEQVECKSCGLSTPVPLYWLFGKAKVNIVRDDDQPPIP